MKSPSIFSLELEKEILELKSKYPKSQSALIPALLRTQEKLGGSLTSEAMSEIAQLLNVPKIEVMKTATFYSMFNHKPIGKHLVQVCVNISCSMLGGRHLVEHLEEKLGIQRGETTSDGIFTLIPVQCLGACHEAPVVQIDSDFYPLVNEKKIDDIIASLRGK